MSLTPPGPTPTPTPQPRPRISEAARLFRRATLRPRSKTEWTQLSTLGLVFAVTAILGVLGIGLPDGPIGVDSPPVVLALAVGAAFKATDAILAAAADKHWFDDALKDALRVPKTVAALAATGYGLGASTTIGFLPLTAFLVVCVGLLALGCYHATGRSYSSHGPSTTPGSPPGPVAPSSA